MKAQRALTLLASSFGLSWVSIAMTAGPGPAAFVSLSGRAADAGLYFAVYSLSSAGGGALIGRAMDRWGRRAPLVAAHLLSGVGFAVAGLAYRAGFLPAFIGGEVLLAFGLGGIALTRVAAAELFGPTERARAVARVAVAAAVAAIAGPLALVALGSRADALVWFLAPPLFVVSALLVASWKEERPAPASGTAAPSGADARIPMAPFALGVLALLCASGAMVTIMGVTGVEMRHAGHGASATGVVFSLHFLGMFGLSLVVGRIADRIGRRLTVLAGVLLMASGGATVALLPAVSGLAVGLLLVGLGWSFAYIGGTVVLTDILPAARRARVIGLVDLSTALVAAGASFGGGLWYAERGMVGLGLAAIVFVAIPALAALRLRERTPGSYHV